MDAMRKLQEKVAREGLHRVVAARLADEGFQIDEMSSLKTAAHVLGVKLFMKNAEYRRMAEGVESLRALERGEV